MTHKLTIATAIGLIMMASGPSYGEQIKTYPGQPLCSDQDGLLALIIAGIHRDLDAMNAVRGCRVIPAGSTTEVIERLPSGTVTGAHFRAKGESRARKCDSSWGWLLVPLIRWNV